MTRALSFVFTNQILLYSIYKCLVFVKETRIRSFYTHETSYNSRWRVSQVATIAENFSSSKSTLKIEGVLNGTISLYFQYYLQISVYTGKYQIDCSALVFTVCFQDQTFCWFFDTDKKLSSRVLRNALTLIMISYLPIIVYTRYQ